MIGPFMPCLENRNPLPASFIDVNLYQSFFIRSLQKSDALYKSLFFIHYLTLFYDYD